MTAEWRFTEAFTLGGILSYVRGINRDNDDNLYRIAPLRGAVTLDWEHGRWTAGTRVVLVADQDEVAAYNGETTTPGHATVLLPSHEHGPVRLPDPPGGATTCQAALDALAERFAAET